MPDDRSHPRYGRTELTVSPLCIGTSGWHNVTVPEARSILTTGAAHGIAMVDTSNEYAGGRAEELLGAALAELSGDVQLVVQTKLDRNVETGDFGYEQMFTSLRESLARLGIETVPVLMLHDPEHIGFKEAMRPGGPVDALVAMHDQGIAEHIGISGGPVDMLLQFVETDLFDTLITHNRMTLLDQSADALLTAAAQRDMGISNAAPFGAGILTGDERFAGTYAYAPITEERDAAYRQLVEVCAQLDIPIGAAALQFSLHDPRIHTTVVGVSSTRRLEEVLAWASTSIDEDAWPLLLDAAAPRTD
jgi:D-threo-aldose 1-dehydrogenase